MIARNNRSTPVMRLNERWWQENLEWSYQDRLSLPVVLRELSIRPVIFAHNLWLNPWLHFTRHARDD